MRDFEWDCDLWCVVKDDGNFAGIPCLCYDEARELASQHDGAQIFRIVNMEANYIGGWAKEIQQER